VAVTETTVMIPNANSTVHLAAVARKSSIRGLDVLKFDKNSTDCSVLYFNLRGLELCFGWLIPRA